MARHLKRTFDCAVIAGFLVFRGGRYWKAIAVNALMTFTLLGFVTSVSAQSNIRATRHNLSTSGTGSVKATSETQVCVFCHTPHGANTSAKTPLWNRSGTTTQSSYTRYTSSSLDANVIADGFSAQPGGSSVLCLSCHDGTVALGNVNVLNGKTNQIIALNGTDAGKMPAGSYGATSGFTRNLGTDLSNDHPISITYNDALAAADGELTQPSTGVSSTSNKLIGLRIRDGVTGKTPLLPLEPTSTLGAGQVQCATCHDPHITKEKFLRLNRFQTNAAPSGISFNEANDQICMACHPKLGATWATSAHANTTSAAYVYKDDASGVRGFPTGASAKKVWEIACLNCHDTHTVSGSRRLLREGTGITPSALSSAFQLGATPQNNPGGNPLLNTLQNVSAIENTCYQCHNTPNTSGGADTVGATILKNTTLTATSGVPDIFSEFARTVHMPIKTSEQAGTTKMETHDIRNANMIECRKTLGNPSGAELAGTHLTPDQKATCDSLIGSNDNRHVECTDCHNPHRVIKNSLFNAAGTTTQRTHTAGGTTANLGADGNIASGVLRGTWGVEPGYPTTSTAWPDNPTYTVKKGNPANASTLKSEDHLTREYQLCLKCHSNYTNSDLASGFPVLGNTGNGTATGSNGVSRYTNVAAEFAANANDALTGTDQGENGNDPAYTPGNPNGSPNSAPTNHRSWHPVIFPTGRTSYERTGDSTTSGSNAFSNIRPPFNITDGSNPTSTVKIGKQTMQCSDCHGDAGSWTQGASNNATANGPDLTKVQGPHGSSKNFLLKGVWDITVKIGDASGGNSSNAGGATICGRCHDPQNGKGGFSNNDAAHSKSDHVDLARCMFCHIAVPHGWKNKAFLANLLCIGPEVGKPAGCTNAFGDSGEVTKQLWAAPYYNGALLRVTTWKSSNAWSETSCGGGSGWMSNTCQAAKTTQQVQSTGY